MRSQALFRLVLASSLLMGAVARVNAQKVTLHPAPAMHMPTRVDSNSPVFWSDGLMSVINSANVPLISRALPQMLEWQIEAIDLTDQQHVPLWIEAAWKDDDGTIFFWYHHEPSVCEGKLTSPVIGAAVSYDDGRTIKDLGIVLQSGDPDNCEAKNGFFAGGHGDLSVVVDRDRSYFYFFFTNYAGPAESQGVVTARLAFADRYQPAGAVSKYFEGQWAEPGIGGRLTPIFPAVKTWDHADADSFWGPSIHWNKALEQYVILMNHACCEERWYQEGIYWTYSPDLSNPLSWKVPERILSRDQIGYLPGWYPQVVSFVDGETDSHSGRTARLFIHGTSEWEIEFEPPPPPPAPPAEPQ